MGRPALAWLGGRLATGLEAVTDDPADLDRGGWWAVVQTFEGAFRAARFAHVAPAALPHAAPWRGPARSAWASSMSRAAYVTAGGGGPPRHPPGRGPPGHTR